MGLARYNGTITFVERKYVSGPLDREIIRKRAENLAILPNSPKDPAFRTLHCEAIFRETERFTFVYRHPTKQGEPKSLLDFLSIGNKYSPVSPIESN